MGQISLDLDDYFHLTRAVVYAELKKLRKTSDVFGDELLLTPDSALAQEPLAIPPDQLALVASRVGGFFGLAAEASAALGGQGGLGTLGQWAGHLLEQVGPRPRVITFYTSGSTGEPKPIVRDYYFLEQDALHLAEMLQGTKRILGLVLPHHIYGFIYTVLIPKVLGAQRCDLRFKRPARIIKDLAPGDALIGFPHIWRLCSETKERFPAGVIGVTSTGPCPPEIIRTLKR